MSLAKQVVTGTGMITLAGIGARLIYFLTVPILSPLLGPGPYGIAALVGTVISLGSTLALLGIDMGYARFYLQEDAQYRAAVENYCWRFAAIGSVSSAIFAGCVWYFYGGRWLAGNNKIAVYSIFAIVLSATMTMASTRIRLLGNYRRIALVLFIAAISSAAVSIGIALYWRTDVWVLLFGTLTSLLITLALLGLPDKGLITGENSLSLQKKRDVFFLGLAGSVTAPMYWLISSADRWFIAEYGSLSDIGVYSMAASIAMIGLMLNSSLTLTWFPESSRVYGEKGEAALEDLGRMISRLVVGLAVVWLAVTAAGGDILRLMAAPEFHPGAIYIPWLAGGIMFYGLASLANTALFLQGRMRYAAYLWLAGGGLCLLINCLLVPRLGALGAAIAQCSSYGVVAIGIAVVSQRVLLLPIQWTRLAVVFVLVLIAGIVMSPPWSSLPLSSLFCKLPVGILTVAVLLRLIAPDWFERIRAWVLQKNYYGTR